MMLPRLPARTEDLARPRINRAPSPVVSVGVPWVLIMLASMVTFSPIIASAPVLPPLAFMVLLAWRMLRPGMLPIWAGLPLGAFDDLYSGQPFGSGIVLWSVAMLVMDMVDQRVLWRGFVQDWLVASALLAGYVLFSALIAGGAAGSPTLPLTTGPQLLLSLVLYPIVTQVVALFDRIRLLPLKRL